MEETGNIFVGNLSWEIQDEDLRKFFEGYGPVISARVICDKRTGHSKGFAFVELGNPALTEEAIRALSGLVVQGRPLKVARATRPSYSRDRA
jgi:RNA recognition motif-containing protein